MRFMLTSDDDGHWYIIPADERRAFDKWVRDTGRYWEDPDAMEYPGDQPEWARAVGGSVSLVTFENPEISQ